MIGTVNKYLRQQALINFIAGLSSSNLYLVFSLNSGRKSGADQSDNSDATVTSVYNGTNILPIYAVKLDNNAMFAIKTNGSATGSDSAEINGNTYVLTDDISDQLDERWTSAYFNAAIDDANITEGTNYNIVSLVYGLDSTAETISDFTTAATIFANAEVVMQTRPATKDLYTINNDLKEFPVLITF